MTLARDERLALCALLEQTGPSAPTLCDGWTTRDLAAHLVLRERRPDAGAGIVIAPLASYTRRVQQGLARRESFDGLISAIRNGPPRMSVFGLPGVDERANLVEFFVHHEDIRRGTPGWAERKVTPALSEALWRRLGMARFVLRKAPVGVELVRDDITTDPGQGRVRITAKARTPVVTVTGAPGELTLWTSGRRDAAQVRLDGTEAAVRTLSGSRWGHVVTSRQRPGHGSAQVTQAQALVRALPQLFVPRTRTLHGKRRAQPRTGHLPVSSCRDDSPVRAIGARMRASVLAARRGTTCPGARQSRPPLSRPAG